MSGTKIKHTMIADIINLVSLILYYKILYILYKIVKVIFKED